MASHVIIYKDTNGESIVKTCDDKDINKILSELSFGKIFEINTQANIVTSHFPDTSKDIGTFVRVWTNDIELKTYITKEEEVLGYIWNGKINVLELLFTYIARSINAEPSETTSIECAEITSIEIIDETFVVEPSMITDIGIPASMTKSTVDWINHKPKYGIILEQIQEQLALANEKIRVMEEKMGQPENNVLYQAEKNLHIKNTKKPKQLQPQPVSSLNESLIPSEVLRFDRNKLKTKEERDRLLKRKIRYSIVRE